MKVDNLGYCGLQCATCPLHVAKINDDAELRIKTAKEWQELYGEYLGGAKLKPQDMECSGCRADGGVFTGCAVCPMRQCCREKQLDTCAACDEYEVCEMINGFMSVPSNSPAKENMDKLRKHS